MRASFSPLISGAAALLLATTIQATTLQAQKTTPTGPAGAASPHVKSEWTIGTAHLSIEYGRPYLKGRPETQMMPDGAPWRTGADEATVLVTDKPLKLGSINLAPGTYTLNTQPGATEWQLLVGKLKAPGQWGIPYEPTLEIGRALVARHAIADFTVNAEVLAGALGRNPILVTALNPVIGYEKGAAIAKKAYAEGRPIREMAEKMTDLPREELARLLDPADLARGGIKGGTGGGG